MKQQKKSGIYIITNQINGKIYIGSSKNIKQRWQKHKAILRKNEHHNIVLQNAVNKYGLVSFKFDILEECTEEILIEREKYWVKHYGSLDLSKGYNLVPPGMYPTQIGRIGNPTKSARIKAIEEGKQIEVIDVITLKVIDRLPLLTDVCAKYNLSRKKASLALNDQKPQYKGYILQHQDKPKDLKTIQLRARRYAKNQELKDKIEFKKKDLTEWRKQYSKLYWKTYKKPNKLDMGGYNLTD